MGFLVIPEAIAHLLAKEEGAPISAILAEVGHKSTSVSIIRAGKLIETKNGPISDSIVESVENLIKQFTIETLPARIILFDGGREEIQQKFISHKWSRELPFLHLPRKVPLLRQNSLGVRLLGEDVGEISKQSKIDLRYRNRAKRRDAG
jgi:hypothetical protein